ncbi:zinc finger BED domain-containing protein DAYSLEEPER-like [Mangifera indica]|uniref:zinc finger BED domain-containing protein DAYSLEEPER-like n=1 Tax=Mangifera indica TaxID=29780 RepID=UPI001CFA1F09|nr:zinc finger BED domain-containing protein DAYSLEEPER-like [Mangifera indica]XP_044472034.1 zinc finger BED domain-containing protein DAYSLEEPER-like [Mangifera indica]XP_044472035.1 zinc finger BED domain-containing protein DAYSLEEPER-like [Mangifera indica]XP_044472036.1 zinc finger BED domain-containing protein DAYSLEEPER-like [Mangifera indica]
MATAEETQLDNNVLMTPETQPNDVLMTPETQPNDESMTPEIQPNDEGMTPHMQPKDVIMTHEAHPNDVMMTHEEHPNVVMMTHETQPSDVMMTPETQPDDGLITPETRPNEVLMTSETQANDVLITAETQPNNVLMTPETQLNNERVLAESQPNNEPAIAETEPKNELAIAETHPNNELAIVETHPNNELAIAETHPNNELAIQETHPNNELPIQEMHPSNEIAIQQTHSNNELPSPDTQPDNVLALQVTQPNNEVTSQETQPNKRRKKKSMVWEHFTIETVSAGCRRACCKRCKQSFAYSTGSKVAGTSHLKRHIAKGTCPALLRSQDNNQLTPYTPRMGGSEPPKRRYRSPNVPYISFDQDRCRHEIARMIIMHNYPLHMVEHPGFITFVKNLQPRFDKVSFNTVQGDCVATYLREKQSLMKFIEGIPGRFCLTLDLWTSSQSLGYVFITGHFIDSEWRLQKRTLNVVVEPYPESDGAFSHAVAACLSDWSLEGKLFSLTFSHPISEAGLEHLRALLCIRNHLILNGQLLLGNCIARTFSSMAKVVLEAGQGIVKKIRDSVKYVKTSESHEEKFLELKQQLQVPSEKCLSIDDQTKWDTTYQMLVAASELREVFSCLDTSEPDYKGAPSMEEWKLVETLCAFLKPLFDSANILTTTTNPTAVTFFHEAWKIHSDLTRAVTNEDPFVSNVTKAMLEKIDKYWKDCCLVLAIAVVMDPRFKMKLVEFSFTKLYGVDAPTYIKIVDDGIHELFQEYVALPLPLTPTYIEEANAGVNVKTGESQGGGYLSDNGLTDFDMYIMETTSQQTKSELDQYLDESLLPRVHDFDVLGWWKLNKLKYPTLSKMARDILSIPVSSVAPDSVFDTVSKEMDQYRSSLRPETVEALICAKDWFQYGSSEASNALVKMEF